MSATAPRPRATLSIPTKIFLGFAAVIVAFGSVLTYSLRAHDRSIEALALIHQCYLRLTLTLGEIRGTQGTIVPLLDRLGDPHDRAVARWTTGQWRRIRPQKLEEARRILAEGEALDPPIADQRFLARQGAELGRVAQMFQESEPLYEDLFAQLENGRPERAQSVLGELERREVAAKTLLRRVTAAVSGRMDTLRVQAERRERVTLVALLFLAIGALAVSVLMTVLSQRMLQPLPRLLDGVLAVARGDLGTRLAIRRNDEIGRLAAEFDRMIEALVARDAALREQARRLVESERLATIGKMAAHITHEIRNPLNSIGLNTELLDEEVGRGASTEARALLDAIEREIERLRGITEEYLRFARLPKPELESEDVGLVIRSLADFVRPELEAAGVAIDCAIAPALPRVLADEGQVRQALLNLVRNAREAMPHGGTVRIAAGPADGGVEIEVADTGPGIPAENLGRIFEPFFSTKEHGTGIGLALVRQIVVEHGGSVRCESVPERGTRFFVWLPAASAASVDGWPKEARA